MSYMKEIWTMAGEIDTTSNREVSVAAGELIHEWGSINPDQDQAIIMALLVDAGKQQQEGVEMTDGYEHGLA